MPLGWQDVDFSEYGRFRRDPVTGSTALIASAFAIAFSPLRNDSESIGVSWHSRIVQAVAAGLWNRRGAKEPILACYAVFDWALKLFIVRRRGRFPTGVFEVVRRLPGYMEYGQQLMTLGPWLRPIVAWDPPSVMVVLWPPGADGETDEQRVLDSGAILGYSSYPASDHSSGVAIEEASLDYVIVPAVEHDMFEFDGKEYHVTNRWLNVVSAD